nr:integrase core domain-containing protein [Actinoplanes globisporus]
MFEKVCRENGILQRLTKPRSPTTTGKIERWHKTLRRELLDHVAPFESLAAAQEAIDGWVHAYNHQRPHQSLDMATPASLFRLHGGPPATSQRHRPAQTRQRPGRTAQSRKPSKYRRLTAWRSSSRPGSRPAERSPWCRASNKSTFIPRWPAEP